MSYYYKQTDKPGVVEKVYVEDPVVRVYRPSAEEIASIGSGKKKRSPLKATVTVPSYRSKNRPYAGAGMLFWCKDNGKIYVLLGKRANHHGLGYHQWSIPGGGKEYGEDLKDTAIRESSEEVGWTIHHKERVEELWNVNIPSLFRFYVYSFRCKKMFTLNKPCNEFTEIRWFCTDNLPKERFILLDQQISRLVERYRDVP